MIPRYSHPLVEIQWSDATTRLYWLQIETEVLRAQLDLGLVPEEARPLLAKLEGCTWPGTMAEIDAIEERTKHDVAAFLQWVRSWAGPQGAWLHFGLTSSDLVDTTQGLRFEVMESILRRELLRLHIRLDILGSRPVAGRTHGQPGEPTSMAARAAGWRAMVSPAATSLSMHTWGMRIAKLSGPMGTFAHNPPELERVVSGRLGLKPQGAGATQIVPRTTLALWASSAAALLAACAKIATDMRLMNMLGQMSWPHAAGQVGSSALPLKNNPIVAEQICGVATMAAGYASMLQPLDLWLERDISHSGPERVAVPDLWHTLLRGIRLTGEMLDRAEPNIFAIELEMETHANELWSHKTTLDAIRDGETYDMARELGRTVQVGSYDLSGDAEWFTCNYPGAQ